MSPERFNPGALISGDDIVYSNFRYDPACYYFIYIGELKAWRVMDALRGAIGAGQRE